MCWGGDESECVWGGEVSKAGFTQDIFHWSLAAIINWHYKNM